MKFEIDIEAPEGHEFTGEVRCVRCDEYYLPWDEKKAYLWDYHKPSDLMYPILREKIVIKVPDFIPKGWWIARDSSGSWFAYSDIPTLGSIHFSCHTGHTRIISNLRHNLSDYGSIAWQATLTQQKD